MVGPEVDVAAPSELPSSPLRRTKRPRRHRAPALLLTSFGWLACALSAGLFAAFSPVAPLTLLVTGAVLLVLCARGRGDVPYAAVGVAASGVVASVVAAAVVVRDPLAAVVPVAVSVLLAGAVVLGLPSMVARAAAARSGQVRWALLVPWLVVLALGAVTFPSRRSIEVRVEELVAVIDGGEASAPTMGERAADRDGLEGAPAETRAAAPAPATRWTRRALTLPAALPLVWAAGLLLAAAGGVSLRRTLRELSRLEGAVPVRRTRSGFVLEDGEMVALDREPEDDVALALLDRRAAHYRTSAHITGVVVGSGTLGRHCEALRRRMVTVALGTVMTTGAAWLPLAVLGAHSVG